MEIDYGTASISQAIDMVRTSHAGDDYGIVARFRLINFLVYVETPIPPINLNAPIIFGAIVKLGSEVPVV
jgi:hypothetical protein